MAIRSLIPRVCSPACTPRWNFRRTAIVAVLLGLPLSVPAQRVVRVPDDVESAAILSIPVDPATRVVIARPPPPIERGDTLESLGLTREQLVTERAVTYSPAHLEDEAGRLAVFYASLVKQGERWVFWSDDVPKAVVQPSTEFQITLETERDTRYLVDFVVESGEQEFAVIVGETRSSQTPANGHIAVVMTGTGRAQTVRVLPLGDEQTHARHFTLFNVVVTPLR